MPRTDQYPGHIDRPGTSWRWRVRLDGERHTYLLPRDGDDDVPVGTETLEDGTKVEHPTKEEVADFARREYPRLKREARKGQTRAVTMSELLEEFEDRFLPTLAASSQRTYSVTLRPVEHFFTERRTDPRARDVTRADVAAYLDWRRMHGPDGEKRTEALSKWTLQKERAILHRLFDKAQEWGYVRSNPVSKTDRPKPDRRDPVILDDAEYDRLVAECYETGPMLGLYVVVLGETGMRCESEALWLRWEDVDLEDGFLRVVSGRDGHRTKSGEGRDVPLTPRLREALREHAARFRFARYDGQPSPWIFHHTFQNRGKKAGDRVESMRRGLTSAAGPKRADLPERWRPHDLRHRRVTTWLAEGKSPAKVKEAVGHADLQTTMGYYSYAKEHLRSLVEETEGADLEGKLDRVMGMLRQVVGEAGAEASAASEGA